MDRPSLAVRRAGLAAAHASYLACRRRVAVVVEGALLAAEDGPLFGQMYVVEGSARSKVDAVLAAHPYRQHGRELTGS